MADIFFISDTHFSHAATFNKFVVHRPECHKHGMFDGDREESNACGCPFMRPFSSVEEMDETLIENWNKTVPPSAKVYHLGDVAIKDKAIDLVGRCNGHKRLIRGNHDVAKTKKYAKYFEEIYSMRLFDQKMTGSSDVLLFTHIPIHAESLRRDWVNVHGHVHNNVPATHFGSRYVNICVEVTDYRPLSLDEVLQRVREQRETNRRQVCQHLAAMGVQTFDPDELDKL